MNLEEMKKMYIEEREIGWATWEFEGKPFRMSHGTKQMFDILNREYLNNNMPNERYIEMYKDLITKIQIHRKFLKQIQFNSKKEYAEKVHKYLDLIIKVDKDYQKFPADQVKCKKGCSNCCYQKVAITSEEAHLLKDKLTEEDIEILKEQVKFQDTPEEWTKNYPKSKCVFLKNNECSIYEDRPASCRTVYVLSDPSNCHMQSGKKVTFYNLMNAELFVTALTVDKEMESIPKMILNALDEK